MLSCLSLLGDIEEVSGHHKEAASYHERALTLAQDRDDHTMAAQTLIKLGEISYRRTDYVMARDYFRAALQLARNVGNCATETQSLIGLGAALLGFGDEPAAAMDLRHAV